MGEQAREGPLGRLDARGQQERGHGADLLDRHRLAVVGGRAEVGEQVITGGLAARRDDRVEEGPELRQRLEGAFSLLRVADGGHAARGDVVVPVAEVLGAVDGHQLADHEQGDPHGVLGLQVHRAIPADQLADQPVAGRGHEPVEVADRPRAAQPLGDDAALLLVLAAAPL